MQNYNFKSKFLDEIQDICARRFVVNFVAKN